MKDMKVAGNAAGFGSKVKAALMLALLAMFTGPAFASGGGSGFDVSAIISMFVEYTGYAVALIGAWALAIWSLRAMGLLTRRG